MTKENTEQNQVMTIKNLKQLLAELTRQDAGDDFQVWLSCDEEGNEFLPMFQDPKLSLAIDKADKKIILFPSHR